MPECSCQPPASALVIRTREEQREEPAEVMVQDVWVKGIRRVHATVHYRTWACTACGVEDKTPHCPSCLQPALIKIIPADYGCRACGARFPIDLYDQLQVVSTNTRAF